MNMGHEAVSEVHTLDSNLDHCSAETRQLLSSTLSVLESPQRMLMMMGKRDI
jgi:hypothetical protein